MIRINDRVLPVQNPKRRIRIKLIFIVFFISGIPFCFAQLPDKNEKLFTILPADYTRVDFNNKITDTKEHSILLYSNYYGGAGVGIGDINNDGLLDIYFAGNLVRDRLYLNKGNMVFEDITEKAGLLDNGGWSSGVLIGDVNDDGYIDIYVTRELYDDFPELRKNLLYINNGNNTFSERAAEYGVDDNNRTRHATFLDYDKDGDLDLFLLNQPPNPGDYSTFYQTDLLLDQYSPRLYENKGGNFIDVTKKAGLFKPGFANSVTASDLNGDGWTDLWISNDYWVGDFMYMNNGDGTFTNKVNENARHLTLSSMGIDAGDINNDGLLDVIVLDMEPEDHIRRHSNMGGMNPEAFNKVVGEGRHYQYFTNTFYLNDGNAFFSEIAHLAGVSATDWSWSEFLADLDNDGWKDLFIANGLMRDIRDYDAAVKFRNFIESEIRNYMAIHPNPGDVSIWDIANMDKAMNISPSVRISNYAYRNNHDLTFSNMTENWGLDNKTFSNGTAYGDLDNDGDLDIVVNNVNDVASIYMNNSEKISHNHYLRINPVADRGKKSTLGTKIWIETDNGNQFFEITSVRGMYSTSEHIAHFGLGEATRVNQVVVRWPDGKENILRNIKADQQINILYTDSKPVPEIILDSNPILFSNVTNTSGINYKHEENIFDDYKVQALLPYKMSELGPSLASGDINGDGYPDLFIGSAAGFESRLFIQKPDGSFEAKYSESLAADKICEDMGAAFFDADGDKDLDLYVVSGGNEYRPRSSNYQDRLYLNDGKGNFTKSQDALPKLNISGSKVYPRDFDLDGDMDLFVAGRHIPWSYPDPESSILLRNTGGKFENVTKELAPDLISLGMANDAGWVDFNNDGLVDLVIAGEWMPLTFLQNEGGHFRNVTAQTGLMDSIGWWFSVESADMDHDGDQDLVAGNFGLNSEYRGTSDEPLEIYYYDFDNNGLKDIVIARDESGKKYPFTRKKEAAMQVPAINDKFKTFDSYAKADVFEIYGKENMERALHYKANTFSSMYIENIGNGHFLMHELPKMAQFSSVNDIIIDDFNGDNLPDILVAGNLYSMETNYPRNDAGYGLLLEGDGRGNFNAVNHQKSGFFVPYDVKSMVEINGKNGKFILVGCNRDSLQVFKQNK